jgi:hypothetical protein
MGLRLSIKGADEIHLDEHSIISGSFMTDTPDDSNARSTDVVNTIRVKGKIITAINGEPADDTMKIARWSLVRAEVADSYRTAFLEVIVADQVVRKYTLPDAFVVDYTEDYLDIEGTGTFDLTLRQKKDRFDLTTVEGGYGV